MKTLVIWTEIPGSPKYYLVEGDQRKFEGQYINEEGVELEKDLYEFFYSDKGLLKFEPLEEFPYGQFTYVVRCGFVL